MSVIFGIDPGKSGSISAIYAYDADPHLKSQKLDVTEADVAEYLSGFGLDGAKCVIEKVSSSPQMGVTSAFTFGRSYGFLRGLLVALKIPFVEVSPQKWQKAMGCLSGGDKNKTKAKAQQLWPHLKITHANADSLLIAEYGRRFEWKSDE